LGHDRSAKNIGGIRYARFHDANNQDWSHHLACINVYLCCLHPSSASSGRPTPSRIHRN
jgi:hypothetical protein